MTNKWVIPMKKSSIATFNLFCFPHSGGNANVFRSWAQLLPDHIQVYGIQYPGRSSRFTEPMITRMEDMVEAVYQGIRSLLNQPYAFFGHSLGGGIALDTAKKLQAMGNPPKHLFISGRRAAHLPRNRERITQLPEEAFRKEVFGMGGMPKEILSHPELMDMVAPILRADLSISEQYQFDQNSLKLNIPLTAMGGSEDHLVEEEALQAWQEHTSAAFACHVFDGGHFYIDSQREAVVTTIEKSLLL